MNIKVTVFTPTFNRGNILYRVFESLCAQTFKDFEWIIIDDGSNDNTKELVNSYILQNNFPIIYRYQENSGKHIAMNRAVEIASGELFVIADSDDRFLPESLEILVNEWEKIAINKRAGFKGVTCRCLDVYSNEPIGKKFIKDPLESNDLEIIFKYKCKYDMWGILNKSVLKEYPFPEVKGLRFFPEAIIWQKIARKYKTIYINKPLLYYYKDQSNATTASNNKREKENIYLWKHYINDVFDYFRYDVILFLKAFIGLTRDGLLLKMSHKSIIRECNGVGRKFLCIIFIPAGTILYFIKKILYKTKVMLSK